MSDDEKDGARPRRATVKMRRRSLRVPVDEVPRRSSPSMPRISVPGGAPSAAAPLPPLEPQRTDPGLSIAELSETDIEVEESREMEVVPPLPAGTEDVIVSSELEALSTSMGAPEPEPTLAELGLDAKAVAAAAAEDETGAAADLAPEATVVTDAPSERGSRDRITAPTILAPSTRSAEPARMSDRPPPSSRPSDRPRVPRPSDLPPAPARVSERPPAPRASAPPPAEERMARLSSPPSNPGAVVVVSRVAMVGTPTPAEPLRVSVELAKAMGSTPPPAAAEPSAPARDAAITAAPAVESDEPKDENIEVELDEARTSAPPEEPPDEIAAEDLEIETAAPKPARPSRPPPPRPSMPAAVGEARPAPPPPPMAVPSGPPPAPPAAASAAPREVSAPPAPPPPRDVSAPPVPPAPPPPRDVAAPVPPAPPAAREPAAPPAPPAPPPPAPPPAAAAAPSASAAPAPTEGPPTDPRRGKKKGSWWEDFFNDDYLRTVPAPNPKQVRRQVDFIEQRLGLAPGATLLDVGCGLGLHAIELTRRGYVVVGLDLSLPMLSRAADEAQDQGFKINFLHADMREMSFESAFDAVLNWGTTYGYFDDDVNRTVLDRMHKALKPGGLLLLDVVNRDYVIRSQPNNVWFEGDGCVVMEETQCNYITSRLHVKRTVMLDDGRQRESAYSVRLYSLHELGQMLHKNFRVVEVSGRESTPGVYFGADSPRTIVVAERRLPETPPRPPGPPAPPKRSDADQTPPPAAPPTSDHG